MSGLTTRPQEGKGGSNRLRKKLWILTLFPLWLMYTIYKAKQEPTERGFKMATKMSAKMEEAYNQIIAKTEKVNSAKCFGEWYSGSEEAYEEMIIRRVTKLGERRTRTMLKYAHERYDLARQGIVSVDTSYSTVKALVKRGLIEEANVYGLAGYAVKLVEG